MRGSDGRSYVLCSACGHPRMAGRHHAPKTGSARHYPHVDAHPFRLGLLTTTGKRGQVIRLCDQCGKPGNAPGHRAEAIRQAGLPVPPKPEPKARTRAARSPTSRAATSVRAGSLPAAELVGLAIAIDRALALPPDALGWRLRLRLADVRPLLGLPVYPTLAAPDAEPDPEAPDTHLRKLRPALAPKPLPVARDATYAGILRGIQSTRNRNLVRRAHESGWAVALTGAGHVSLRRGDTVLNVSTTQREGRGHGWANLRADAKRAGIDVTGL